MNTNEKALRFRELHNRSGVFLIPNPWDIGSARLLAGLGFEALATSSAACAAVLGRRDNKVTRDEAIAHAGTIANSVEIPVSADFENGFGDDPAFVAETVRMAAAAGLSGCSIEDVASAPEKRLYDVNHAVERITAAAEAARSVGFPFTLTARAENFVVNNPNLEDTIARLRAYEKAGADVLFAPGLPDLAAVKTICSSLAKPVNFMVGIKGKSFTVTDLAGAGVKRISFASSLYRAAMTGLADAAREAKTSGTFNYLDKILTTPELNGLLAV